MIYDRYGLPDSTIDNWPYWLLEENIKIMNDIQDERNTQEQAQQDQTQQNTPNMDTSSYMKSMSSMANKFK